MKKKKKQTKIEKHVRRMLFIFFLFQPVGVAIYGKMDQSARKKQLLKFTSKTARVLFVTDLAARGIDIPALDVVINYDFPEKPKVPIKKRNKKKRKRRKDQRNKKRQIKKTTRERKKKEEKKKRKQKEKSPKKESFEREKQKQNIFFFLISFFLFEQLFVHRVGRVARAGRDGIAYSLVSKKDIPYVLDLALFLAKKISTSGEKKRRKKAKKTKRKKQ